MCHREEINALHTPLLYSTTQHNKHGNTAHHFQQKLCIIAGEAEEVVLVVISKNLGELDGCAEGSLARPQGEREFTNQSSTTQQ